MLVEDILGGTSGHHDLKTSCGSMAADRSVFLTGNVFAMLPDVSVVVPVFNEELSIEGFLARVIPILESIGPRWEILFVNDGSTDATFDTIRAAHALDARVRALDFSRNFGKEVALSAGLDHASGNAVIPIDVDLQDPPELIVEMVARWRQGFDVVLAQRIDRSSDTWLKRVTASMFYRVLRGLSNVPVPTNVGDFRLLDAKVVEAVRGYRERARFMKGIMASVGYRTCTIPYTRDTRANGKTKFRPLQLIRLALEGIISFSDVPLKIWTYVGGAAALGAIFYACFILVRTAVSGIDVPGYASIIIFTLLFNGLTLVGLGVQGEYIARIFSEVKGRPLYLVRTKVGLEPPSSWLHGDSEDACPTKLI
jgi:glycosyltransferase involved in cell wall biosynthesis